MRSKLLSLVLIFNITFLYAESSIYGFGINNNSYSEPKRANYKKKIRYLKQKIDQQNERIDGLTTIIEGLSASINELQYKSNQNSSSKSDNLNTQALKRLASMIDKINNDYVSKKELHKILTREANKKVKDTKQNSPIVSMSNAKLYSQGVRYFKRRQYKKSKANFSLTDKKGYKIASSNYYLGEIAYYTKNYEDAILYFKKSAELNDRAGYIDVLLLHTAVSLERSGEKQQAIMFYKNIISNYPYKNSAKISKNRLRQL